MQAAVGIFEHDENIQSTIYKLKEAGFAEDKIKVLTDYDTVQRLFGSRESQQVGRYTIGGAIIGIVLMSLYSLILGGYACTMLFGYIPVSFLACNAVGSIVVGLILGTIAGWFLGVNKFEKSANQYTHGVGQGYKLMAVQVNDELTPKVTKILRQENAEGVKTFYDLQEELTETPWQKEW